jgi:hypothetical protein
MKIIMLLVCLAVCNGLYAQRVKKRTVRAKTSFPQSFIGHWQGTLYWYPTGKPQPQTVNMELHIQPADTPGHYTWQIVYGKASEDNRPYILKPVDTAKGHWVIDEKNGIVLDSYWVGQRFCGAFTVQGNTILDSYWLQGDTLHAEFFSYKQEPVRTSGHGTDESPKVDSYRMGSYQKAVMVRRAQK